MLPAAGNAALDDGSPKALHDFLSSGYAAAQAEDDRVTILATLDQGGDWYKATAQAALEGPALPQEQPSSRRLQRQFLFSPRSPGTAESWPLG